jgi:predicted RNase H-like nuclease (RuvC/YqgF family)
MNPKQYSSKKRAVSNVPRPNLFSHEKRLKDSDSKLAQLNSVVLELEAENRKLKAKVSSLESKVSQIANFLQNRASNDNA